MVYYSEEARDDFDEILDGLISWKKHPMEYDKAKAYVLDIRAAADTICKKRTHFACSYKTHKRHGEKVFTYRRNSRTQWYVIYNFEDGLRDCNNE